MEWSISKAYTYMRIRKDDFPPAVKLSKGKVASWLEMDIAELSQLPHLAPDRRRFGRETDEEGGQPE